MKKILFLFVFLLPLLAFSQDIIVRTNGQKIKCKVLRQDSTKVYLNYAANNGKMIETYIPLDQIDTIKHEQVIPYHTYFPDRISLGLGIGISYGALGGGLTIYPQKNIGVFGNIGYAIIGVGYNVGIKLRGIKKINTSIVTPTFTAMYGYQTSIKIKGAEEYNKFFYGITLGIGIDARFKRTNKGYWSFELLVPLRGSEVQDYLDDLEENHNVKMEGELMPIGIAVGYKFVLN